MLANVPIYQPNLGYAVGAALLVGLQCHLVVFQLRLTMYMSACIDIKRSGTICGSKWRPAERWRSISVCDEALGCGVHVLCDCVACMQRNLPLNCVLRWKHNSILMKFEANVHHAAVLSQLTRIGRDACGPRAQRHGFNKTWHVYVMV